MYAVGESGHILIHESGNRLNSYEIYEYSEGHVSFYSPMLVDLTKPRDQVNIRTSQFRCVIVRTSIRLFPLYLLNRVTLNFDLL